MNKPLIIAEKPDMGRKIASALSKPQKNGNGFIETPEAIVSWAIGHVLQSFEPEDYNPDWGKWNLNNLPMLVDEWRVKVDPSKAKQFNILKDLIKNCSEIIHAGDPGREGQLIVDEILYHVKNKKPVKRILLFALDAKSVKQAFNNLRDNSEFKNLYMAGIYRGYADWTMGLNGTQVYTLKAQQKGYRGVLSVGRVQSPTLAIVVNRDEIIENFVPHDYYIVTGTFEHEGQKFNAYWKPQDSTPTQALDKDNRLIDINFANNILKKIIGKNGLIKEYEESEGKENAPLPFNLSKMQIYASAKWGMGAKEVLDTCQALYEKHELQTYPRTDCQYLPENQFDQASTILANIAQGVPNLSSAVNGADSSLKSPAWNDSKLGEHFGLIPTQKQADLSQLNENEKRIYLAVCERYIAQFYPACEYKTASILVECEQENFKANGKIILKQGWRAIFNNEEEQEDKNEDEEEQVFPNISPNQEVLCSSAKKQDKKTSPPARFTEGTLIKAMTSVHTLVSDPEQKKKLKEKKGIGQEATRTGILEKLFKHLLLLKEGKKIVSSPAGRALIKALPKKVTDPALTAIWEDALDKIAEGKLAPEVFKAKQDQWVTQLVAEAKNMESITISGMPQQNKPSAGSSSNFASKSSGTNSTSKPKASKKSKKCPDCDTGELVEKTAKASGKKFLGCSNWPKCNHVEWPKK